LRERYERQETQNWITEIIDKLKEIVDTALEMNMKKKILRKFEESEMLKL
jgi:hypothetical protein